MLDASGGPAAPPGGIVPRDGLCARAIRAADVPAISSAIDALTPATDGCNPHALPPALAAADLRADGGIVGLAVEDAAGALYGFWPLRAMRAPPGLTVLKAPVDPSFDLVGAPLIRAGAEHAVIGVMIAALAADRSLPGQIVLRAMPACGLLWHALEAEAAAGHLSMTTLSRWERGLFDRRLWTGPDDCLAAALSPSRRKRLRAKRKALSALGPVTDRRATGAAAVAEAFEHFLRLEASGWKGARGTALSANPADAAYVRATLTGLAARGDAFVELLECAGRPVAAGLFIQHGETAYFWKTAYDAALAKHSPGVLLDMALTARLFDDPRIRFLDTGTDDSVDPASMIWSGRRTYVNAVLDLRPGSIRGGLVIAAQRARAAIRRWRLARRRTSAPETPPR